jgi:hypothetical protein
MVEATSAYLCENSPAMLELEGIVDQAALRNVLLALEQIYSLLIQHRTRLRTEAQLILSSGVQHS